METALWSIVVGLAWLGGMIFQHATGRRRYTVVASSASANTGSPKCPRCKSNASVVRIYVDGPGSYKCEKCVWHFDV